jgi:hypothetical protein
MANLQDRAPDSNQVRILPQKIQWVVKLGNDIRYSVIDIRDSINGVWIFGTEERKGEGSCGKRLKFDPSLMGGNNAFPPSSEERTASSRRAFGIFALGNAPSIYDPQVHGVFEVQFRFNSSPAYLFCEMNVGANHDSPLRAAISSPHRIRCAHIILSKKYSMYVVPGRVPSAGERMGELGSDIRCSRFGSRRS